MLTKVVEIQSKKNTVLLFIERPSFIIKFMNFDQFYMPTIVFKKK